MSIRAVGSICENERSILIKDKVYNPVLGKLAEAFFVYNIYYDKNGVRRHKVLTEEDYPECKPWGISSLTKAKKIFLLNSI